MNNKDQPFFESLSYRTYQKISKQTIIALFLFLCIAFFLALISVMLFYQWRTIQSERAPLLEQTTQFAKIVSQKQELIQKLEPSYRKNKKRIRILEKLETMNRVIQKLFEKRESVDIISCVLKNKKLTLVLESRHNDYTVWIKKLSESKLFKSITTTHVKRNELSTIITIEGDIIF